MRMHRGIALALVLITVGCGGAKPVVTPAGGARVTGDVLSLANDAHRTVFEGYKAGTIPASFSDPFMKAVDERLLPAARKVVTGLKAWEAATTVDLKAASAADLRKTLADFEGIAWSTFGLQLPPGVAASINSIAGQVYDAIAIIRARIVEARSQAERVLSDVEKRYLRIHAAEIIID